MLAAKLNGQLAARLAGTWPSARVFGKKNVEKRSLSILDLVLLHSQLAAH
jgi:hypothetical protein